LWSHFLIDTVVLIGIIWEKDMFYQIVQWSQEKGYKQKYCLLIILLFVSLYSIYRFSLHLILTNLEQGHLRNISTIQQLAWYNVFNRFTPQSSLVVIYVIVYALIVHTTYSFSNRMENLGANFVLLLLKPSTYFIVNI
jgi:hypothetical protein